MSSKLKEDLYDLKKVTPKREVPRVDCFVSSFLDNISASQYIAEHYTSLYYSWSKLQIKLNTEYNLITPDVFYVDKEEDRYVLKLKQKDIIDKAIQQFPDWQSSSPLWSKFFEALDNFAKQSQADIETAILQKYKVDLDTALQAVLKFYLTSY